MQRVISPLGKGLLPLMTAVLVACGGGGGGGGPAPTVTAPPPPVTGGGTPTVDACGIDGQKEFALAVANDWYLWYDEMADVDPADYSTVNEYLLALTEPLAADGRDPGFSFMTTVAEDEAGFTSGAFVGFGFRYGIANGNQFFISDALEGGPAFEAGFARGIEVLAIDVGNGFETIAELAARGVSNEELFGANEAGVERSYRLQLEDGISDVTIAKRELDTPPLAGGAVLIERDGNSPVGYVHMRRFISTANDALSQAFTSFAEAGVTDLVIDLRYNGGGLVSVAENMLNMLAGQIAAGQVSFEYFHNDKRTSENRQAFFAARNDGVTPLRIAFITSGGTASASELVINSLSPLIEVVLVGEDTLGKAVGQYAFDQPNCENRLRLVGFEIVNGEGQGGYYTGLVDSGRFTLCPAADDITAGFGDPSEDSLDVALGWLNEGVCGVRSASAAKALVQPRDPWSWYPETPVVPDRRSPLWQ